MMVHLPVCWSTRASILACEYHADMKRLARGGHKGEQAGGSLDGHFSTNSRQRQWLKRWCIVGTWIHDAPKGGIEANSVGILSVT